jgi:hypothetical protein
MTRLLLAPVLAALAACGGGEKTEARRTAAAEPVQAPPSRPAPSLPAFTPGTDSARLAGESGPSYTFRVHPSLPPYAFTLLPGPPGPDSGAVAAIRVRPQGGGDGQLLPVEEDQAHGLVPDELRISVQDIDFDGYGDLAFLTGSAQANTSSDYWRFDPRTRRFVPLGTFQTLSVDSAARELTSYQRGGRGGLLFTASRYRWVGGRLAEVRREEQDWDDDAQRYVHVVRELRGRDLEITSREVLTEEEAIARAEAQ